MKERRYSERCLLETKQTIKIEKVGKAFVERHLQWTYPISPKEIRRRQRNQSAQEKNSTPQTGRQDNNMGSPIGSLSPSDETWIRCFAAQLRTKKKTKLEEEKTR